MLSIYLSNVIMLSRSSASSILFIIVILLVPILFVVYIIILNKKQKKNRAWFLEQLNDLFNRHNKLFIGMSEQEMLNTMNFRFDKNLSEDCTTYRFVFIPKGGSGSHSGVLYGSVNNGNGGISGFSSGSSETHDESIVIVECKDNKVTKVNPYNMSNVQFPFNMYKLATLANSCGIYLPK